MAKQYEMLFKLGAQLGTDFSGTFSSAQKILSQTQKEIQTLNKEQNSIKAFEKQSNDVKKAQDAYNDYQAKLRNVREEMANASNVTADMKNKEIDLERAVANAAMKLGEKQAKLDALGNELREAGVNTEDLAGESKRLSDEMDDLKKAEEEAAEEAEDFGNKGEEAFESIGKALVAAGILEGLKAIGEAYLECVDVSAQFAYQMSGVQAVSGASAADMELLSQKAKQMGANTKFTASESGEALEYMAMAGWKTEDMLGGLEGIMYLAAAANEELGLTSDIVTDALTAFGLKASDSGHFADVLAQASSNANTNVSMMGQTFKYAAPLAGTLGYTIEDVALAAGLMANSGIKAEQAGTALRAMFTRLSAPPKEAEEALKQLGISIENADGTAKPLRDTIAELTVAFSALSDVEQTAYASSIAGQNAMSGFLALVNAAPGDVARLTAAVDNANGAAERMANVRLDNLAGQTELFNSALDATKMTIGEAFAPELEALTKAATEILNKINEFLAKHPEVTRAILAFVGTIGAAMAAYVAYKGVVAAVKIAQDLLNISMSANPIGLVLTGVAALTAATVALCSAESETATAQSLLNRKLEESKELYHETAAEMGVNSEEAKKLGAEYAELIVCAEELAEAEQYITENLEKNSEAAKAAQEEYNNSIDAINEQKEAALALVELLEEYTSKTELTGAEQKRLEYIVEDLNGKYENLGLTIDNVTSKVSRSTDEIRRVIYGDAEESRNLLDSAQYVLNQSRISQIDKDLEPLWTKFNAILTTGENAGFYEKKELLKELKEVEGQIDELEFEKQKLLKNNSAIEYASETYENSINAQLKPLDTVLERLQNLKVEYQEFYDEAYKSISGQYNLWEEAAVVVPKSIDDVNKALETQTAYWSDYYTDLAELMDKSTTIEGLDEFVASFADGSEDSVNMIAALANASDEDITSVIENWGKVNEMEKKTADGVAGINTGYAAELAEIENSIQTAVEELNLSDEAANAAQTTIDAYIEQLKNGEIGAVDAANSIRNAVANALGAATENSNLFNSAIMNVGANFQKYNVPTLEFADGYASGTDHAAPGWHLVGEEGPELVMFGGGERVLDAGETRNALGGTSVSISVPVTVYGNTDDSTARDIGDSVVERVLDALREAGVDARRSAYA